MKYLVWFSTEYDDGEPEPEIMTAAEIFAKAEPLSNAGVSYGVDLMRINSAGEALSDCTFRGTWHDVKDPTKMVIVGDGVRETYYVDCCD